MSWWKKLLSKRTADPPASPSIAKAPWIAAADNRFGVPILDLRETAGLLSASRDPTIAARAVSWRGTVGDDLDASPLDATPAVACALRYPAHAILPDGLLFTPNAMEEKWVLALRGDRLLAARSWTGDVEAVARMRREPGAVVVEALHLRPQGALASFGDPVQIFDWLIRSHALGQDLPLPVSADGAALLEHSPVAAFSAFGRKATCAAVAWDPPTPSVPLRVDGRVVAALLAQDADALRALAARGESLDVPSPTLGETPLGIAAIRGDVATTRRLLELGANPDLGDDGGNFPLGRAIVHHGPLELLAALADGGARVDVANHDGFGLLHAAAEVDRADVVPWLVERGVPLEARTGRGHTALQIAAALGHVAALEALAHAGADLQATSPDGTAREIAERQGKPDSVAALDRLTARA